MDITEVRVKLVERSSERLRAFCSITLDSDFVIRDLKIIDGTNGAFVAMPSRKLADRCSRCGNKNHLRAKFCNECGQKLNEARAPKDAQGRAKLHADVAHPINAACRERIQAAVLEAFHTEVENSKSPDYRPPKYDDLDEDFEDSLHEHHPHAPKPATPPPPAAQLAAPEPLAEEEPAAPDEEEAGFEDYSSLIAELKKDAAARRDKHEESRSAARGPVEQPRRDAARPDRGRSGRPEPSQRGDQPRERDERRPEEPPVEAHRPEPAPAPKFQPPRPAPPTSPPPPQPAKPAGEDDFGAGL
jgi:stage V sporulation protein G